jgi:diguanylate cyclase (GGDEF)-like protein
MMDVDHFKTINDSFGHEAGDSVLIKIANILTKKIRQSDIICRYGGEEILLLLFDINSLEDIKRKIEEIRIEISETTFINQGKPLGTVTASFGIACLSQIKEPEHLITEADRALYISKKSGRNKITIASP